MEADLDCLIVSPGFWNGLVNEDISRQWVLMQMPGLTPHDENTFHPDSTD